MGATVDFITPQVSASQKSADDGSMPEEDTRWPHEFHDDDSPKSNVYSYISFQNILSLRYFHFEFSISEKKEDTRSS